MPLMIGKDPYWQQQQYERWGQAVQTFMAIQERRKQRKEAQFQDQLRLLAETPELATGQFGSHFSEKWAKTHPEAPLIVDTLRNKGLLAQQMKDAEIAFNQQLLQERAARSEQYAKIQQLPDQPVQIQQIPDIGAGMGPMVNAANLAATQVQGPSARTQATMAWQQMEPDWLTALKKLPQNVQLAYHAMLSARGKELPEDKRVLDPKDLSEKSRGVYAFAPEAMEQAVLMEAGVIPKGSTVWKEEEDDLDREDTQTHQVDLEGLRNKNRLGQIGAQGRERRETAEFTQEVQYGLNPETGKPNPRPKGGSTRAGGATVDPLLGTAAQSSNDTAKAFVVYAKQFEPEDPADPKSKSPADSVYEYRGEKDQDGMPVLSEKGGKRESGTPAAPGKPPVTIDPMTNRTLQLEAARRAKAKADKDGLPESDPRRLSIASRYYRLLVARVNQAKHEKGARTLDDAVAWAVSSQR